VTVRNLVLVCALPWFAAFLHGQTSEEEQYIENVEEGDASGWMDRFETARASPMDVNRASPEELTAFPLVSPLFAKQVVEERKNRGSFQSWADFVSRTGLNDSYAGVLGPYFIVSGPRVKPVLRTEVRARFSRDFPDPEGYGDGTYAGNPMHATLRAKIRYGEKATAGFLMEKDPGESRLYDHAVGFLSFLSGNGRTLAILGHFFVEAGQGLVLAGPFPGTKGADPVAPLESRPLGARGYLFAAEGRAFRGLLLQKRLQSIRITVFSSKRGMDGSMNPDGSIRSTGCSGYHRTASEIDRRNAFSETMAGLRLEILMRFGTVGLTGFGSSYSKPVFHENAELYRFDFSGRKNAATGCDWNLGWKNLRLTGEAAVNPSKATAFLTTLIMDLPSVDAVLSARRYDPSYDNPNASGFAACETRNESGLYAGFTAKPHRHATVGAYVDVFRRPWRTYFNPVPVRGEDLFLRVDRTFPRLFSVSARLRFRLAEKMDAAMPDETAVLRERLDRQFRLDLRFRPVRQVESKLRFIWVKVHTLPGTGSWTMPETEENGFGISQELRIGPWRRVQAAVTGTAFRTDSYDSRVYVYENDLDGVFSLPMFYDRGVKWHVVIEWKATRKTAVSASLGLLVHAGATSWGSGPEQTQGNSETRLTVQMDRSF
jgi:hypothetical protein